MWKDSVPARIKVVSLKELDALVGKYLTLECPKTYWEEQHASFRFDSLEEAEESLNDPYFQHLLPEDARRSPAFVEVQEYRRYSSDLSLAWEVVEHLSGGPDDLRIRREKNCWIATFGHGPAAGSRDAATAICLAALRSKGFDVDFVQERTTASVIRKLAVA